MRCGQQSQCNGLSRLVCFAHLCSILVFVGLQFSCVHARVCLFLPGKTISDFVSPGQARIEVQGVRTRAGYKDFSRFQGGFRVDSLASVPPRPLSEIISNGFIITHESD
ncbi:hypothetical protein PoB_001924300 [Plakobranchus ocellatus]|uniref:Uncharacterized protein n=1 Tax=Plakobranchus ocellatus TaxID=259542 RepID=A0AAV3ZE66_9GAST|nr:hypothetical protein PoB_001924300 [Plakobranchus ocellatus]